MNLTNNRVGGLILLGFFLTYVWLTQDIQLIDGNDEVVITARTLPSFYAIVGMLGAGWLMFFSPGGKPIQWSKLGWLNLLLFLALMSAYGFALRPLGFLISTSLFLGGGFFLLGERRSGWLLGIAITVTMLFWTLLNVGLGVYLPPLPAGLGGNF